MKAKTYILQAGFLPIGQTDVTGWRTYLSTLAREPTTTPWPPTAAR